MNSRRSKGVDSLRDGPDNFIYGHLRLHTDRKCFLRRYTIAPEIHKVQAQKLHFQKVKCGPTVFGSLGEYTRCDMEM